MEKIWLLKRGDGYNFTMGSYLSFAAAYKELKKYYDDDFATRGYSRIILDIVEKDLMNYYTFVNPKNDESCEFIIEQYYLTREPA